MHRLSAHDILQVWELGQGRHPVDRALLCLAIACPELTWDEIATLSIGQRDAYLLTLREQTFGATLGGFAQCPQCAERLEFTVTAAELRGASAQNSRAHEQELVSGERGLRFRPLNSWDLAAVTDCEDVETARRLLVRRCVLQVDGGEKAFSPEELSEEVVSQLALRIADCDPQAEVLLSLTCPGCAHHWQAVFDIESFLWTEICVQAKRLLREVHTLARAYGWREVDILSMSATRRQMYMEMVS
jgi:hypothetical protein